MHMLAIGVGGASTVCGRANSDTAIQMLTFFSDQHTNALDRATREETPYSASCVERSDRSEESVRPVAVQNDDDQTNAHSGGTRRDKRTQGCFRLGRPTRTSSNAMETEEQPHVEFEKDRVREKVKTIKNRLI